MDKWQTQDQFWNSFRIPAYDENTSFTEDSMPAYPHITYEAQGGVMGQILSMTASIWYHSTSWADISKKADEILESVHDGIIIRTDEGLFWIRVPELTPFAQRADSGSDSIRRMYITLEGESLSAY